MERQLWTKRLMTYNRPFHNDIEIYFVFQKYESDSIQFDMKNSLDAGIQDSSTSISIMYKIEEMSHEEEEENGDESDKHI